MDFKHKNHLVSSYLTLQKQIREIRDTIYEGRPPTKANASLTPLPENIQDAIISCLERISEAFIQLVERYAAAELEGMMKREPVSATKMWASIQLRQLQENLSDMHPDMFEKKYGKLDPEERLYLKKLMDTILQELRKAEQIL